ncbi:endothelin-converting enzyme 2-like [Eriocheir sinensis]|uniref:endothelin-converting enzyme 2-like n=1 Tax=Eriocheir sinensis TaxID=95602 RepID=UPI0021C5B6FC|nr:endothelin-converting enzyme 2-like [Eriocheir sinensis]XP_050688080.1 endothelin-converting enzyme 2-like [Eriocheir sinensis]
MAGARTRTTGVLVILALVFIAIIIILCLLPLSTPAGSQYAQNAKSRPLTGDDVLTDEPPPTTTTTTTTRTTTTSTTGATTTTAATTTTTAAATTTTTAATTTTTTTPTPTLTTTTTTPPATSTQPSTPSTTPSTTSTQPPPPLPTTTTSSTVPSSTTKTTTTTTTPAVYTESGATNTTTQSRETTTTATERTPVQMHSTTLTTTATTAVTTPISSTTESSATTLPPLLTTSPTTTTTQETTTTPTTTTPPPPPPTSTTTATTTTTTATTPPPPPPTSTTTATTTTTTTSTDSSNSTLESTSPLTNTQTSSAPLSTTSPSAEALTTIPATTSDLSSTSMDLTSTSSSSTPSSSSTSSSSMTSPQPEPPVTAAACPTPATSSESEDVCMSPACKTLAARILDLMDHSGTSPCEDFYQYACGGVTDDLFLAPESQLMVTRHLILDLIKGLSEDDPQLGVLKVFYNSCTSAETESRNTSTWLAQVKAVFDAVYSPSDPNTPGSSGHVLDSNVNITRILIGMMKIHFAPFFDLLLDVSDDGADEFVLMLTPPVLLSPFSENLGRAVCYGEHLSRMDEALHSNSSSYDVNNDYENYCECMGRGKGLQVRLLQMRQAVEGLGLMHHFNYTSLKPEGLFVDNLMDTEFLLGDLYNILPRKPDLRDGHLKKNYKKVPLSYIEQKFMFPNFKVEWVILVEALLGRPVDPATTIVHLYFERELLAAFEEIDFKEPAQLQRILLLLLAERLYTDLVEPAQHGLGKPEYCLQTSTKLLGDLVSSLYVSGLPRIQERQEKIEKMMEATKEAAEKELKSQPNLQGEKAASWLKKLRDMSGEVASHDPSLYSPRDLNKLDLSENFVDNCMILLTRYRSHMYQQYQDRPSSPSILWSHFLKPFNFAGISLYASNKFLMPYAAMEAPLFFWDVPDYINYAGVGHMIAHEVMHGFDGTGSLYNGTHRHQLDNLDHFVNVSECLAFQYRSPQSLTAASGLTANFTLGRLPLNEFLADSGAARLAWEAYEHSLLPRRGKGAPATSATPEPQLPWLDLNPLQLYFLRIAQKHCTPTSDTHMLAIMENEHLPAKLRINLVLQNEPLFTEAFSCPAPAYQCPYVLG